MQKIIKKKGERYIKRFLLYIEESMIKIMDFTYDLNVVNLFVFYIFGFVGIYCFYLTSTFYVQL